MGTYRLMLAILVMLAHMGTNIGGRAQGVAAVVSFFIISGFVMTALIKRNYPTLSVAPWFFLDRAMRIFPQYLFYVVLTVAAFAWAGIKVPFIGGITVKSVLANAFLLPTGLYTWEAFGAVWIPQAWSLGLEATFYLFIPFLLILNLRIWAVIASMVVFTIAYLGIINTETWGYMSLSGTLFIFLCGSMLYDYRAAHNTKVIAAVYVYSLVLFVFVYNIPSLQLKWSFEVLLGVLLGLPVIIILSKIKSGLIDAELGNISYGAYLNHSLIIYLFEAASLDLTEKKVQLAVILSSILCGWFSFYLVERPVVLLRRRLRTTTKNSREVKHETSCDAVHASK